MKQLILLFSVICLHAGQGFFSESFHKKKFKTPEHVDVHYSTSDSITVTISIDITDTINPVLPSIFSNNANSTMGKGLLSDFEYGIRHLQNANINTMRIPGGSWSNQWLWDGINHWGNTLDSTYLKEGIMSHPVHNWNYSTDELLQICSLSHTRPQICVNFALSRYINAPDAVEQAAHYAAEWVRDVNVKKGLGVQYWEVGNENFAAWEQGFIVNGDTLTAEEYGKGFCVFVDSMKAADSSIKIGAVVVGTNEWSDIPNWTKTVVKETQNHADFLVVHDYFNWKADANTITTTEILAGTKQIKDTKKYLTQVVSQETDHSVPIPIAMTEFNIFGGKKNPSFLGALFLSRALGEFIKEGYGLANYWGTVGGWDNSENDMGMLSRNEPFARDYTPHATFFTYYYYSQFFGDHLIKAQSTKDNIVVHASRFSSGHIGLVLSNSSNNAEQTKIAIPKYSNSNEMYYVTIDADSLTSRSFRINGEKSDSVYNGPIHYEEILPFRQKFDSTILFTANPNSINFIVLPPKDSVAVIQHHVRQSSPIIKVAAKNKIRINMAKEVQNAMISLYNIHGTLLEKTLYRHLSQGQTELKLSQKLSKGFYILEIKSRQSHYKAKLLL